MNRESRARWRGYLALVLAGVAVLAVGGAVFQFSRHPAPVPVEILPTATSALSPATPTATQSRVRPLRVDVAGAVKTPGVYKLAPDSIVADAIAAAGGPAPDADLDRLNKASALVDGMQIYVPHLGQPTPEPVEPSLPPAPQRSGDVLAPAERVNINTATQAELEALPGIGPALSQRIMAGRPYAKVEELLEVKGIGEAIFAQIREHISVQ